MRPTVEYWENMIKALRHRILLCRRRGNNLQMIIYHKQCIEYAQEMLDFELSRLERLRSLRSYKNK